MGTRKHSRSGRHGRTIGDTFEQHTSGVETISLESHATGLELRTPLDRDLVLGKILTDRKNDVRWTLSNHLGTGGMAYIYRATPSNPKLPPRAVKVCQDRCEMHNVQTQRTARLVQQFEHHSFPKIFASGRFRDRKLQDRRPAYIVLEELQRDPLTYLRAKKVLGLEEALHPNIALQIAQDLIDHALVLNKKGLAHGDIHPFQVMLRMSPSRNDPVRDYCRHLQARKFEVVVADCDTIGRDR